MRETTRRGISLLELGAGAAIVVGHNVLRVLPNEVPILFVLALLSAQLRNGTWRAVGLERPPSWKRTVVIAIAAVIARLVLGQLVESAAARIWPPVHAPSGMTSITGNLFQAAKWLGIVWTFAAFGEEIGYRGYLTRRAADVGGNTRAAYVGGIVISAVMFGIGHYYKGPVGILDDTVAGLVLGAAYLASGRNLWAPILAHGVIDTIGIVFVYFGLAT